MRRFWLLLLAITTILVIALPAGAVKPPKPTPVAPVAVSLEGNPMWVHEVGDDIGYSVTVQNKTRVEVTVEVLNNDGPESATITIQPRNTETVTDLFSRKVTQDDINNCLYPDDPDNPICDLFAEVTVRYADGGDVIAVAETSTLVDPVDKCIFKDKDGNPVVTKSGLCIWKPPSPGTWEMKAVPYPVPTRPTNLMMTMRDGVPGNWCTLPDDEGGGVIQERWLKSSSSIVLNVYLPGTAPDSAAWIEPGMCLTGGHGVCFEPDCYFAVGNPESFYLYTTFDGIIKLTYKG